MQYFWKEQDDIPSGMGYALFSKTHLLSTGITLLLVFLGLWLISGLKKEQRSRVLRLIPVIMLCMELFKDGFLIFVHRFGIGFLPLHICSIGIFVFLIREYSANENIKDFCGEVSYVLIMPASLAALLFPDWTVYYPVWNFMNLYSFLWHGLLVFYPLALRLNGYISPSIKKICQPVLFLTVITPVIFIFDRCFGCNYFFVNWPPEGTPLEWLASIMGVPGYLAGYAVLVVLVFCAVYLVDGIVKRFSWSQGHGGF